MQDNFDTTLFIIALDFLKSLQDCILLLLLMHIVNTISINRKVTKIIYKNLMMIKLCCKFEMKMLQNL